jgi:L-arabinose isomerase
MKNKQFKAGIILNIPDLYRRNMYDFTMQLAEHWKATLSGLFAEYDYMITETAHTKEEFERAVTKCEESDCKIIVLLPMAYTASGVTVPALCRTRLPLIVVSTSRDETLAYDINGTHLLANQAMHGVQDICNGLWRHGKPHVVISGHPQQALFAKRFQSLLRAAHAAWVIENAKIGQLGGFFPDMLDFRYNNELQEQLLGYQLVELDTDLYLSSTENIPDDAVSKFLLWMEKTFKVDKGLQPCELKLAAQYALAFESLQEQHSLDGLAMNFMGLLQKGVKCLPFLGADCLMAAGYGYAGEGDVQTAALMAALFRIAPDTTFSEMFCPDYERNEILMSHMGECNYRLANPSKPIHLKARPFAWGECERLAVPIFQLKPGPVTLTAISEEPDDQSNFRLITCQAEIIHFADHVNLLNPHSRMIVNRPIHEFIEQYSHIGGPHHLCLSYGDIKEEIRWISILLGINYITL